MTEPAEVPWRRPALRAVLPAAVASLGPVALLALTWVLGRTQSGDVADAVWPLVGVVFLALGFLWGWLFTRWRITPDVVEVRRGLFNRRHLTVARDRVRSVDSKAGLLARLFGVADLTVGTGVEGEQVELKGVFARDVAELRAELMRGVGRAPRPEPTAGGQRTASGPTGSTEVPVIKPEEVLATFSPAWLRFAPLTSSGLVAVIVLVGFASQLGNGLHLVDEDWVERHLGSSLLVLVLLTMTGVAVLAVALSFVGYATKWWGLRLVRQAGHLELRYGLFTTRTVTLEERRVRGVRLHASPLLRLAGGARLEALVSGTEVVRTEELLPLVPVRVAESVAVAVLGTPLPVDVPLVAPTPRARVRRFTRGLWTAWVLVPVAFALITVTSWMPLWAGLAPLVLVPLGLLAGWLRARHMGYVLLPEHLVVAPPAMSWQRVVLRRDGVIGWVLVESLFQRRAGLATLVATTAVGARAYPMVDLPREEAVDVAAAVTPRALRAWLSTG